MLLELYPFAVLFLVRREARQEEGLPPLNLWALRLTPLWHAHVSRTFSRFPWSTKGTWPTDSAAVSFPWLSLASSIMFSSKFCWYDILVTFQNFHGFVLFIKSRSHPWLILSVNPLYVWVLILLLQLIVFSIKISLLKVACGFCLLILPRLIHLACKEEFCFHKSFWG